MHKKKNTPALALKWLTFLALCFLCMKVLAQQPYLVKDWVQGQRKTSSGNVLDTEESFFFTSSNCLFALDKANNVATKIFETNGSIRLGGTIWNDTLTLIQVSQVSRNYSEKWFLYKLNIATRKVSPVLYKGKMMSEASIGSSYNLPLDKALLFVKIEDTEDSPKGIYALQGAGIVTRLREYMTAFTGGKTKTFFVQPTSELWVTDGSISGTKQVGMLPGTTAEFSNADSVAYFTSNGQRYMANEKGISIIGPVTPFLTSLYRGDSLLPDNYYLYYSAQYNNQYITLTQNNKIDIYVNSGILQNGRYRFQYAVTADKNRSGPISLFTLRDTLYFHQRKNDTIVSIRHVTLNAKRDTGTAYTFRTDPLRAWSAIYQHDTTRAMLWLKEKGGDRLFYLPFRTAVAGFTNFSFVRPISMYSYYIWGIHKGFTGLYHLEFGADKKSYTVTKLGKIDFPAGLGTYIYPVNSHDRLYLYSDSVKTPIVSDGTEAGTQALKYEGLVYGWISTCKGPLLSGPKGIQEVNGLEVTGETEIVGNKEVFDNKILGTYCDSTYLLANGKFMRYIHGQKKLVFLDSVANSFEYTFYKAGSTSVLISTEWDSLDTYLCIRHYQNDVQRHVLRVPSTRPKSDKFRILSHTFYKGKLYIYLTDYSLLGKPYVWEYDLQNHEAKKKMLSLPTMQDPPSVLNWDGLALVHNEETMYVHYTPKYPHPEKNIYRLYKGEIRTDSIACELVDSTLSKGVFMDGSLVYLSYMGDKTRIKRRSSTTTVDNSIEFDGAAYPVLQAFGDKYYFNASHPDYGYELYETTAEPNSTALTMDIRPGPLSSGPGFIPGDRMAYLLADDGIHGYEIWAMKLDGTLGLHDATLARTSMEVKILPNPNNGLCEVRSTQKIRKTELLDLMGCVQLTYMANAHSHMIQAEHLPSGIYLFRIETEAGTAIRKWVKE